MNTPKPPRPPESKGSPKATANKNSNKACRPRFGPSKQPANITPKVCMVMGTPKGKSIFGISPSTAIKAANSALSAMGKATLCVMGAVVLSMTVVFVLEVLSGVTEEEGSVLGCFMVNQCGRRKVSVSATRLAVCSM